VRQINKSGTDKEVGSGLIKKLNKAREGEQWRMEFAFDIGTAAMSRVHIGRVDPSAIQTETGRKATATIGGARKGRWRGQEHVGWP
jgi:hypothetical protein